MSEDAAAYPTGPPSRNRRVGILVAAILAIIILVLLLLAFCVDTSPTAKDGDPPAGVSPTVTLPGVTPPSDTAVPTSDPTSPSSEPSSSAAPSSSATSPDGTTAPTRKPPKGGVDAGGGPPTDDTSDRAILIGVSLLIGAGAATGFALRRSKRA
jgi:hypothetical protein